MRSSRTSSRDDLPQKERHSVLRHSARRAPRGHEKAMATWRQRPGLRQIQAEGPDRAQEEVSIKTSREVSKGLHQEGARDGTGERLRLGDKLRDVGKTGIRTNKGDQGRQGLQFTNPLGCSKSQEKQRLQCESAKRSSRQRLKGRGDEILEHLRQVPSWRTHNTFRRREAEGTQKVPKHWIRRQGGKVKTENRRESRTVTMQGGDTEALGEP